MKKLVFLLFFCRFPGFLILSQSNHFSDYYFRIWVYCFLWINPHFYRLISQILSVLHELIPQWILYEHFFPQKHLFFKKKFFFNKNTKFSTSDGINYWMHITRNRFLFTIRTWTTNLQTLFNAIFLKEKYNKNNKKGKKCSKWFQNGKKNGDKHPKYDKFYKK